MFASNIKQFEATKSLGVNELSSLNANSQTIIGT